MLNNVSGVAISHAYEQDLAALPGEVELGRKECLNLSIGKWQGLQTVTNEAGGASIIAMDQSSFFESRARSDREETREEAMAAKGALVVELANGADRPSSVVVDPDTYGVLVANDAVPREVGLIVTLEKPAAPSAAEYLPGVTVGKVKRMGASAAKLLPNLFTN